MVSPSNGSTESLPGSDTGETSVPSTDNRPLPDEQDPEPGFISGLIGFRGLGIFNGFLNEEWLNELRTWQTEVRAYLEMRDDITISTLLSAIKLPLQGAEFHSIPADPDNQADIDAADFLDENINGMNNQTWRAYIEDAIEIIDFGWAVNEIVLKKGDDGRFRLWNLEPRGQETLRRWGVLTEEPDQVTHMVQGPFRTGIPTGQVALPLWKCVHLVWQGRKGSPQGKSLLRSLYMSYKFLKNFRVFEGIGIERDAAGIPIYTLPPGAGTMTDDQREDLATQLKGLKIDEQMFIVKPPESKLEAFQSASKNYDIRKTIEAYEKAMLMRGFAQFLALGTTNVGTQSLVEGQSDFFGLSLRAFQNVIVEQLNQQLVPYIFQFNRFEGMTELPKLIWDPPTATDIAASIDAYTKAVTAGAITPIRADEETLRGKLNLPELPDDIGNDPRTTPGTPTGGDDGLGLPFGFRNTLERGIVQFQENPDLRTIPGVYEKFVNQYQRDLVTLYDTWSAETVRLMALPDVTQGQALITFDRRLQELTIDMKLLGRQRIAEASGLGLGEVLGKRASSPQVVQTVANLIAQNDAYIDQSLIPSIRERFAKDASLLTRLPDAAKRPAMLETLSKRRGLVASGAGGAQVAIFDTQMAAGLVENRARTMAGEKPIAVRWKLDAQAEHCADDPARGTFGCPSLARVYPGGWAALPTVPAGNVSCLGNCRCSLEADFVGDGVWKRIT